MPSAVTFFFVGQRITPLVSPWSTTTKRESKPEEEGRSVIRSQETCWKGREAEERIGVSGGTVGWVFALFRWQVEQPFNIFADVGGEAGPPKLCSNELTSLEVAWVTSTFVVVTSFENGVAERIVVGDIDTTLVG